MSQETVDRAPQADTGFDEVAAYYEDLNSQRRRQVAAFLGLTSTASEEVVDYAVDMHQKLFEKQ